MKRLFLTVSFLLFFSNYSWAGGAAERQQAIQDAYRNQAEQAQQQAIEQKIREQQAQQQAVYEQAVQQRRFEQERAAREQALRQRQFEQERQAYEEAARYKQAGQQLQAQQAAEQAAAYKKKREIEEGARRSQGSGDEFDPSDAEDVVDFKEIWVSLQSSSKVWPLMMELAPKVIVIHKYVDDFKQQGITIGKSAEDYARMIDQMSAENPDMLKRPFKDVLQMMAIIEYDFDNGQSKDQMALQLLGQKAYFQNRKRLGLD